MTSLRAEPIRTDRLVLRRPRVEDARDVFERYASDPEVTRYLVWSPHASVERSRAFLEERAGQWPDGPELTWAIALADDDSVIGMISARPARHRVELGYVLGRAYWSRGYMTEAARAVVAWAFARPHVRRVSALCDVDNAASARVLEKCGMQREGVLRRFGVHPNVSPDPRDVYCYAVVR